MKSKDNLQNTAEQLMGQKTINPVGTQFPSTLLEIIKLLYAKGAKCLMSDDLDLKICHGLGLGNMPGIPKALIANSWIEHNDGKDSDRLAYDVIWGTSHNQKLYREEMSLHYYVEYNLQEYMSKVAKHKNNPGPWDPKIIEVANGKRA